MVHEGLALGMMIGHRKSLHEHLLEQLKVRQLIEFGVEGEQWTRSSQAIARHLQFGHCVDVLDEELGRWASGARGIGHPHVQILFAATFEEQGLVAVLHLAHFVDHR